MTIALDAQLAVGTATGIGVYQRDLAAALTRGGADVRALSASWLDPWRFDRRVLWDQVLLPALAARSGATLLHATAGTLPLVRTLPAIVTVHDLAFQSVPDAYPRRGRRWHEAALGRAVRRAAAFVTPSEPVAAALRSVLGRSPVTVTVIEEGADHLPPPDPAAAADLLERLGAVDGFLLAVGTLEPRKNLVRLIEAYVEIRPALPAPWPLVVVGPAGWGAGLEPPPAGVVLAGRVPAPALAALYATCRCLAYVPLAEGFGLPVVEAMRAGAPVVESGVPSAGGASLVVDPLDPAAIGAGLLAASVDGARRDELVLAGRARTAELTWARAAAAHVELWAGLG